MNYTISTNPLTFNSKATFQFKDLGLGNKTFLLKSLVILGLFKKNITLSEKEHRVLIYSTSDSRKNMAQYFVFNESRFSSQRVWRKCSRVMSEPKKNRMG